MDGGSFGSLSCLSRFPAVQAVEATECCGVGVVVPTKSNLADCEMQNNTKTEDVSAAGCCGPLIPPPEADSALTGSRPALGEVKLGV